jgi:RNA polymerase sigma-70 factor, ECF subfamily
MPPSVFRRSGAVVEARVRRLDLDRPLVEAARSDPARFDALYRKYVAQVYSFAFYELADHHGAEDVTEQTFLRALVALPRFQERGPRGATDPRGAGGSPDASTFRVWLFRIARNVVANERRRIRRHPVVPLDGALVGALVGAGTQDVEGTVVRHDEASAAWSAVRRLPDDRRRALVLRFVDEMSTSEIAAVLGRTEGAVRVLIHRALRSVAGELERER